MNNFVTHCMDGLTWFLVNNHYHVPSSHAHGYIYPNRKTCKIFQLDFTAKFQRMEKTKREQHFCALLELFLQIYVKCHVEIRRRSTIRMGRGGGGGGAV